MTGSSLLPATIHNGKLYFLFGKECEMEDSAKGFSDFGGGIEKGDGILETAWREGAEELSGFLGDEHALKKHIHKNGGIYPIHHKNNYHVHIFFLEYDPNLPKYYNQNHRFLWEKMDKDYLHKTKLFEKIEIDWFSCEDIKKRRREFRPFYREIVDVFLRDKKKIQEFLQKRTKKRSQTKTQRKKQRKTKKRNNFLG